MAFNNIEWEFSDVKAEERTFPRPEEGDRYLKIIDAVYDDNDRRYTITVFDLGNEAQYSLSYWLDTSDFETNNIVPNVAHRNALVSLGHALAGKDIGIPNPDAIRGGVVLAHVTLKASKKDPEKKYARVFKYDPVDEDMAVLADIEQYYNGAAVE